VAEIVESERPKTGLVARSGEGVALLEGYAHSRLRFRRELGSPYAIGVVMAAARTQTVEQFSWFKLLCNARGREVRPARW